MKLSLIHAWRRIAATLAIAVLAIFAQQAAQAADAATPPKQELKMIDHKVGDGAVASAGHGVTVHYTGWLFDPKAPDQKGKKFDSSRDRGTPFQFNLGAGQVIRGWDEGVAGMKVGGQRTLIIPPEMAYGDRDVGGGLIPAGSTLVFDVELLNVR
jgi:FKBP-type peptidyl-prolyl cis-trans isomerase